MSILKIEKLGKTFQNRRVVRDISLSISSGEIGHAGEIVGILGPNGAGKTTTFYMIIGMIMPEIGAIYIDDINITELPMYRRARLGIGYLPQEPSIFRGLNVEDNIKAILQVHESTEEACQNRLEELLADFSITHLKYAQALSLSGGERRRVEIARAVAAKPKFLLLDEPFAGVDPIAVTEVKDLIIKLKNKGIGVIITDHNAREILSIADKAYIIHDGAVFKTGSPSEIISDPNVKKIYLGENFL